jgi:hypothetical protein
MAWIDPINIRFDMISVLSESIKLFEINWLNQNLTHRHQIHHLITTLLWLINSNQLIWLRRFFSRKRVRSCSPIWDFRDKGYILVWNLKELEILGLDKFYINLEVLECILYKFRDNFIENWTGSLKTWICIDFNQPYVVVGVNHEIHPKYFKIIHSPLWIYIKSRSMYHISSYLFHPWVNQFPEIKIRILFFNELIKLLIVDFVAFLILTVFG